MADFASYQVNETDSPQIINLDQVGRIVIEDNDSSNEYFIVFAKFPSAQTDENGKKLRWWQQPSNQLMTWKFSATVTGKAGSDVKRDRDGVLSQLLKGERIFEANQLTY